MTAQEQHDTASELTLKLLEEFEAKGLSPHESLFAALTHLIHATFDMAPTRKGALGLLAVAMSEASDRMDLVGDET